MAVEARWSQMPFEKWKQLVDQEVQARFGVSADDLPDAPYRDWHDESLSPKEAAIEAAALAECGFDGE